MSESSESRATPTPARISLFVGKGGVGKSTLACATAVSAASAGQRVLVV
ncbi:MAG: ArsA-related P-loop ATPase, partial [Mycobacterium sp.]